ncbi:hypothetical protein [Shewanella sp. KCT]|uniref:hypothetical protein n=1 Tax=Shewanella sp. KCT TaxID=2569535 RepID=UPI00118442BF|nr:hypothetical protein [Shewanella sp. KCT]
MDKSGVAVITNGRIESLHKLELDDLCDFVAARFTDGVLVVLEDVEANKPVFNRGGQSRRVRERVAQNVGNVKATARHIDRMLAKRGVKVIKVAPLKGAVKRQAKKNSAYFNKLTGWTGRSNEDTRDAALLALFGIRG